VPYGGDHWAIKADFGGHEEFVVFDTGGGFTAISPQAAMALGCKPWGRITGFRMRGDRLDVQRCDNIELIAHGASGQVPIRLPTVGIWDFNSMLPKDIPPMAANLGLDAFPGRVVTLDIAHRQLILETSDSLKKRLAAGRDTMREVPMHVVNEAEGYSHTFMAALDTAKGRVWMNIDSGDDTPITIGRHIADLIGLDAQKKGKQAYQGMLAGGVPLRGDAYVQDLIFDGNIGAPILAHWVITIDLAGQRFWVSPA
jgi:hypothetical protein